ncbi:MAG: hypothetical protein HZC55_08830 [Verrucomicrobia bacterium]|nr:hypothetical protein [Verrucomicrobiota bacterium]
MTIAPLIAAREIVEVERVPITHAGVTVSLEMPKRWVNAPFPIRSVPENVTSLMQHSKVYNIWSKDLSWSRSWFRGPLGHIVFDALLVHMPASSRDPGTPPASEAGFLRPHDLLEYLRISQQHVYESEYLTYALRRLGSHVWVRQHRTNKLFHGIPRSESWMIGLTPEIYLRLDLGCTPEHKGEAGERWLQSVLYWQNRTIGSLQVTGLRQILSGQEPITPWEFPALLKTVADLPD